ncbi:MAG TPA: hypothetical protein VHS55_00005 [Solirubrobacteraceae bacterium]|jgi:hypothetical protein|nr:hypothetical protein [Solirubrobacteraceae bacterium]
MSDVVNQDAAIPDETRSRSLTAADKLRDTLKALSVPDPNAEHLEMMLSSLAMAVEGVVGDDLDRYQEDGQVDEFVLTLSRFLALHRSDDVAELVVVELPRQHPHQEIPPGRRLHLLDEAIKAQREATSPW